MSTRGCVAVGNLKQWRGPYNHSDSYPTWLGEHLWKTIREARAGEGIDTFAKTLLACDDYRQIETKGVCEYCGKTTGQAHSIGYVPDKEREANIKRTGYPDPEAKRHEHNEGGPENHITSANPDPLFVEWVYILDVKANALHVLAHKSVRLPKEWKQDREGKERTLFFPEPLHLADGSWHYGHCRFKHIHVATIPLDGPEPSWPEIQKSGREGKKTPAGKLYPTSPHDRIEATLDEAV